MIKYGVVAKDKDEFCNECGEKLQKIDGRLVCVGCEAEGKFGRDNFKRLNKSEQKWK